MPLVIRSNSNIPKTKKIRPKIGRLPFPGLLPLFGFGLPPELFLSLMLSFIRIFSYLTKTVLQKMYDLPAIYYSETTHRNQYVLCELSANKIAPTVSSQSALFYIFHYAILYMNQLLSISRLFTVSVYLFFVGHSIQLILSDNLYSASVDMASVACCDASCLASSNVWLVIQPVPSLRIHHEIFQIIVFLLIFNVAFLSSFAGNIHFLVHRNHLFLSFAGLFFSLFSSLLFLCTFIMPQDHAFVNTFF